MSLQMTFPAASSGNHCEDVLALRSEHARRDSLFSPRASSEARGHGLRGTQRRAGLSAVSERFFLHREQRRNAWSTKKVPVYVLTSEGSNTLAAIAVPGFVPEMPNRDPVNLE